MSHKDCEIFHNLDRVASDISLFPCHPPFVRMVFLCAALIFVGCGKKTPASGGSGSSKPAVGAEAVAGEGNYQQTAERLTQALRKFAAENRRVPSSLNELVATGYLPEIPEAPAGKQWTFDDQLRVALK